jgi:hypothetical protein
MMPTLVLILEIQKSLWMPLLTVQFFLFKIKNMDGATSLGFLLEDTEHAKNLHCAHHQ